MDFNVRQRVILDGAISIIAAHGVAGVTHRATDSMAQLPQGSTSYYFSKKTDLLRAAALHLADQLERECDQLQIAFAETTAKLGIDLATDFVARQLVLSLEQAKPLQIARIELSLAAARSVELTGVASRLSSAGRRPIEFFVNLVAGDGGNVSADICVGLLDGIALMYVTGQGLQPTTEQAAAVLKTLVLASPLLAEPPR